MRPLALSSSRANQRWLVLGLIAAQGCTLLSDFDVDACSADADCDLIVGSAARCEDSRCVQGCASNRHCSSIDPRYPICPSVGSQCVDLSTEGGECVVSSGYVDETMGSLTGQELLLVGAFVPDVESSSWLTLELAAAEINGQGGLPAPAGQSQRPLLVVGCDDRIGNIPRSMPHLVDELGVRAVLASLEAATLEAAGSLAVTRGSSLLLAPDGAARAASVRNDPLVWSLGAAVDSAAPLYSELMRRAERSAIASGVDVSSAKIASIVSSALEDTVLEETVAPLVELGGKDSTQLLREDRFRRIRLDDDSVVDRSVALAALADYAPAILLVFLGGSFRVPRASPRASVLGSLEDAAEGTAAWRPIYVLGPRNAQDPALRALARSRAGFRARAAGVTVDRELDSLSVAATVSRFESAFPESAAEGFGVVAGIYDALYYLAYALAAAPPPRGTERTAEDVVAGLLRVTSDGAARVNVGPGTDGADLARTLLAAGTPFDTFGTSGAAAFDAERSRSAVPGLYCFDGAGGIEYDSSAAPTLASEGYACSEEVP